MADNTTELEVLDQIVDVLGGQSGQYETVVPTLQQILALLGGGGGSGSGYNPALSVGRADALTGADSTAQWSQRVTEGSGSATVRSVQGAAVAWEQKYKKSGSSSEFVGVTFTLQDDGTWIVNGTASGNAYKQTAIEMSITTGHKYLLKGCPATSDSACKLNVSNSSATGNASETGSGVIFTGLSDGLCAVGLNVLNGKSVTNLVFRPQLFDLTAMFGAGSEPSTVAEFEQMYPEAYYPYSAPTLKPVQIAGIRSTTAQGGELDSVEWTAQTLRAAGSVRDELTAGELVTRVGVVDLGTLTWTYSATWQSWYTDTFAPIKDTGSNAVAPNMTATNYSPLAANYLTNPNDTQIGIGVATTSKRLIVRNGSDTVTPTGTLFYELATPTTQPISPALPMTYKVQQGGTESIIVPEGEVSAAPILTVAEGESAAELVMDALACIAAPDGPVATANHSVGTYLTMQGKLYKVTSAIAVGESIVAGTNVTQTTVMAELIARTA